MNPVEWILLVVAVLVGGIVAARRSIVVMAWIRGREVEVRVTCPKRGSCAMCTMIVDDDRKAVVGAARCSLSRDGVPRCEQECVMLLNKGFPIEDDVRGPRRLNVMVRADD